MVILKQIKARNFLKFIFFEIQVETVKRQLFEDIIPSPRGAVGHYKSRNAHCFFFK
jgi:hypothetical protein